MVTKREHKKIIESGSDDSSKETGSHESDSEPELTQKPKKPSSSTPAAAAKKPKRQSASKPQEPLPTSSGSESDSDGSNPKVRPKPTQKSTDGAAPDPATPSTQTQRVWCEEDEIVVLKGLVDYSAKEKADPFADLDGFHNFIEKDLRRKDSTKRQFQDKIRKLKIKYENNRDKEKKSKKEMTFPKPHEKKLFELSKSIWGTKNVKENGVEKVVGSPKPNAISLKKVKRTIVADKEEVEAVDVETESVLPAKRMKSIGVTVEERIMATGNEMFGYGKGVAGENEWAELRMEEMQAYLRHLEVKCAQARVVIERLKSEG